MSDENAVNSFLGKIKNKIKKSKAGEVAGSIDSSETMSVEEALSRAEEAQKQAEKAVKAAETMKQEAIKNAEDAKRLAVKKAEEARVAEEARKAEEARVAEEARKAEEARVAKEAKIAEEAMKVQEANAIKDVNVMQEDSSAIPQTSDNILIEGKADISKIANTSQIVEETKKKHDVNQPIVAEGTVVNEKKTIKQCEEKKDNCNHEIPTTETNMQLASIQSLLLEQKKHNKNMLINSYVRTISLVIFVIVIIVSLFTFGAQLMVSVNELPKLIEQSSLLIQDVKTDLDQTMILLEKTVSSLDMNGINTAISTANNVMKEIDGLDFESLNASILGLKDAIVPFAEFTNNMKELFKPTLQFPKLF